MYLFASKLGWDHYYHCYVVMYGLRLNDFLFASYFMVSIAVLPHSPGVVYYHLLHLTNIYIFNGS